MVQAINRIDRKSVAPNSKLRQELNKNNWTACFHMETNSIKNPVYLKRGRTFFVFCVCLFVSLFVFKS